MQWLFPEPLPFHWLAKTFLRIFGRSSMRHSSNDHRFCYNFRVYTYTRARSKCQHLLEPGHFTVAATTRTNCCDEKLDLSEAKVCRFCVHLLILYVALIHLILSHTLVKVVTLCCFQSSKIDPDLHCLLRLLPDTDKHPGDFGPFLQKEWADHYFEPCGSFSWSLKPQRISTDCRFDRWMTHLLTLFYQKNRPNKDMDHRIIESRLSRLAKATPDGNGLTLLWNYEKDWLRWRRIALWMSI